jgi:hypothetical protein
MYKGEVSAHRIVPPDNFVEAHISRETGARKGRVWPFPLKTAPPKGEQQKEEQESAIAQDKLAHRHHLSSPHPHACREQFLPMPEGRGILAQI